MHADSRHSPLQARHDSWHAPNTWQKKSCAALLYSCHRHRSASFFKSANMVRSDDGEVVVVDGGEDVALVYQLGKDFLDLC